MSNVQVHCEHCDKSLFTLSDVKNTRPPGVALYTERDPLMRDYPWDPSRYDFCDWTCVATWAIGKGRDLKTPAPSPDST
jgi:hypothetical protein